jgi:hypothetical protein
MQRIEAIGQAIEKYNDANGRLPQEITDLVPHYLSASLLRDPWGHEYSYAQRPERFYVFGFTSDQKPDTDLFLDRTIGAPPAAAPTKLERGGIQLVD